MSQWKEKHNFTGTNEPQRDVMKTIKSANSLKLKQMDIKTDEYTRESWRPYAHDAAVLSFNILPIDIIE